MSKTRSSHFLLRITFNGDLILVFYMWVLNKDLRQQKRALWNNIQLRKRKFYYFWAFAKTIMVSNMILNIMGLYGNVETLVMIVWNPYATHWEHIGRGQQMRGIYALSRMVVCICHVGDQQHENTWGPNWWFPLHVDFATQKRFDHTRRNCSHNVAF